MPEQGEIYSYKGFVDIFAESRSLPGLLWWVLSWPRDGDAPCSQAHVVLAAKGEHGEL